MPRIEWVQQVIDFHRERLKVALPTKPGLPNTLSAENNMLMLSEEYGELIHAVMDQNLVEIIDGCCDLIYVVIGVAISHGIDLTPYFAEVHRSNMDKEHDGEAKDGGKRVAKPLDWQPPNIAGLLAEDTGL